MGKEFKYLTDTTDKEVRSFIADFAYSSETPELKNYFLDNKDRVFRVSEKMLGVGDFDVSDIAVAFYEKIGLENCAKHLVGDCFNTRNSRKRNLAFRLFMDNPTENMEVLDSLIYGINDDKTRNISCDILNMYKKLGINIH
jgi:hypothetical protein